MSVEVLVGAAAFVLGVLAHKFFLSSLAKLKAKIKAELAAEAAKL